MRKNFEAPNVTNSGGKHSSPQYMAMDGKLRIDTVKHYRIKKSYSL